MASDTPYTSFTNLLASLDIIYILGGPGVGKEAQCSRLSRDFGFSHLSVTDLFRAERNNTASVDGATIEEHTREGRIIPPTLANKVLLRAIEKLAAVGQKTFLVDGFPRSIEQAKSFEKICKSKFMLYFEAPKEVTVKRLQGRLGTDGRFDDEQGVNGFCRDTLPVVDYFRNKGNVYTIDCSGGLDAEYEEVRRLITEKYILGSYA